MILKLILKIPTFNIFFEDRSNLAVFSESVSTSINVYMDTYSNITHGFWENSNVCMWLESQQHLQHAHTQAYIYKDTLHVFVSLYVTKPFTETKELT